MIKDFLINTILYSFIIVEILYYFHIKKYEIHSKN